MKPFRRKVGPGWWKASESKGASYYEIDGSKWNPKPTKCSVTKAKDRKNKSLLQRTSE